MMQATSSKKLSRRHFLLGVGSLPLLGLLRFRSDPLVQRVRFQSWEPGTPRPDNNYYSGGVFSTTPMPLSSAVDGLPRELYWWVPGTDISGRT